MADKYISVKAFTASVQERYCKNCDRRKGMKNGKLKMVYAIGDAPCRSCGIDDMLDDIDAYPPADVVARDCFNRILAENDTMREQLAAIGKKPGDKMDNVRIAKFGVWRHSWEEGRFTFRCSNCNYFIAGNPNSAKVCPGCMSEMKVEANHD